MIKRGQINTSFVNIFTLLLIGAVFLFGLLLFRGLNETTDEAEIVAFESDISNDIKQIASGYGDVNFRDYKFPADIKDVVFVDTEVNRQGSVSSGLKTMYPIIADKIESGIKDDVFIFDDSFLKSLEVGNLSIEGPGWISYKNMDGNFETKLEGTGDAAKVGGNFEKITAIATGDTSEIVVEEVPGLRLVLKPTTSNVDAKVALRIDKAIGNLLSDDITVQTLNQDGSDYSGDITFQDSYIEIPIGECPAGNWAGIRPSSCVDSIVRYEIPRI